MKDKKYNKKIGSFGEMLVITYLETHYGEGEGKGKRILNPTTEIYLKKGSTMKMNTTQIEGVDDTNRITIAELDDDATLIISLFIN